MECLSCRVAFHLLLNPVLSVGGCSLAEATFFVVFVAKFATRELYDFERKVMPYAVYMMRKLLRVCVGLVFWLSL